jgi:CRP/FNR family transcriptional regulator, cyclic AMP receptor protein
MRPKKRENHGEEKTFDARAFLETAGLSRRVTNYKRNEAIYSQGDAAETVMYVQKGGVKLSVVNGSGKEAVVAMFGPGEFFGEGCMAGQERRIGTATALRPTTVLVIQKKELLHVLHEHHELSGPFHRVHAQS